MSKGILWATMHPSFNFQAYFAHVLIPPRYSNQPQKPHITLQYGVEQKDWEWAIGQEFEALVWAEAWNDRVQALQVRVPVDFPCSAPHPHITMSWVDGAEPVESNTMLTQEHEHRLISPNLYVLCRIEFHEWLDEPIAAGGGGET